MDTLDRRLRLYGIALDRVLGLPDGSVPLANTEHLRKLISARVSIRRLNTAPAWAASYQQQGSLLAHTH